MARTGFVLPGVVCGALTALAPVARADTAADIELLHNVPSQVFVSSAIRNGKDRAAHLVDGLLDTAWNSQPHVAERSYIDFVVPAAAQVRAIKMTAGFTSRSDKGDLFLMNHRIAQVQVFRNHVSIGTFTLDPDQRGLQELPVHQPGGRYRVQILRTIAGTNAGWTEACVSELQVFGTAPPGTAPRSQTPTVLVGGVVEARGKPVASLTRFCEQWDKQITERGPDPESLGAPPYCHPTADATTAEPQVRTRLGRGQSPFLAAELVKIADQRWDTLLALRTARGWFLYPLYAGMYFDDPGCSGYEESKLLELGGTAEQLALRYRSIDVTHAIDEETSGRRVVTEYRVTCTPGDGDAPLCTRQLLSLRWSGDRY